MRGLRAVLAAVLLLPACPAPDGGGVAGPNPERELRMPQDGNSFARPDEVRVRHLELDLEADFQARILGGTAALDLEFAGGTPPVARREVILDSAGLEVSRVASTSGADLSFHFGAAHEALGRPLHVQLEPGVDRVVVHYRTRPDAAAVQWLSPRQTSGDHPFLFTQGQSILTRSWIPLQDSPGIRLTYGARIVVPGGLRAVMSARRLDDGVPLDAERTAYRFEMSWPIPGYLIALAIGRLDFAPLGPRSGVFAEPAVLPRAAAEFVDTEQMMAAAERLYGPYRWGRYDLLVLPPSFPFGGMENPCLTFATPTIIAGDRSLVALVAHELAHSWSGNLVTNATWDDFWLNEGFTVYIENRIMEELYGEPYARMLQVLGWQDLQEDIDLIGRDHPDTRLHVDMAGRNPDDAFSQVPYEKGALFLRTIERSVGRERFDRFLRGYFDRFAFQPMTAERFMALVADELFAADPDGLRALQADAWLHSPGLPESAAPPRSAAFARVDALRGRILEEGARAELVDGFSTHEWVHLLRGLPDALPAARLAELDRAFALTASGNSEILFEWLRICVRNRYEPAFPALEQFLTGQGRRKFLKPIYLDLVKTDWGRTLAERIYERARPGYHSVSANTIDEILRH